ncbi:MAG: glycosyltransferase family 2 protein [Bdellovibrionales bacterium]|nr:glycosyltransferase family 2 protein [Bdellovibrionales bacterium]
MGVGSKKHLVSIVVPLKNEVDNVERAYKEFQKLYEQVKDTLDFEYVFVDDGSTDESFSKLCELVDRDSKVSVIKLSKNYGFQRALFAGYTHAKGDAAVEIDCDLQDPPKLILEFIKKWQEGYKIVYGIRKKRKEGPVITFARKVFYRLIRVISDSDLPKDAGDFMLIDRSILNLLKKANASNIYIRGLIFSFGFRRIGIEYEREARLAGKSKFGFFPLLALAVDGIVSQSILPLRIASFVGFSVTVLSVLAGLGYFLQRILDPSSSPTGWTSLALLVLISIGINSLFLGIIGEYVARTYRQTHHVQTVNVDFHHRSKFDTDEKS